MSFLRHTGKHNDRKVAVIFREIPGEPHMCLVTYPEILNRHVHDPLMRCIESDIGQHSEHLADALNRTYTTDGKIILQALHAEGQLKKVNTEQIVMTPAPNTRIRLHELNTMLNEMKQGEAAIKKLADMDASLGMQNPVDVAKRMRGDKQPPVTAATGDVLGDQQLVLNLKQQAERMSNEARGLLAEADRLLAEAQVIEGVPVKTTKPRTKAKVKAKIEVVDPSLVVKRPRVKKNKVEV